MIMSERACKICRRLLEGNLCPIDKSTDLTKTWHGVVVVFDPTNSEIAKEAGLTSSGKFALKIKE